MSRRPLYKFRLYIAGEAQNSLQAVANLAALCRTHFPSTHEIELVDVLKEPKLAMANGILMTPTLVRLAPTPPVRIVGTLSEVEPVLLALGLQSAAA